MKILFVGDLYGKPGVDFLLSKLEELKTEYKPNIIIVNGENAANGRGITLEIYKSLMKAGINAITMGNWTWGNQELFSFIDDSNVVRPINYGNSKGKGYLKINFNGQVLLVINALGRTFMNTALDDPFKIVKSILEKEKYDFSFIDFHAEATSEKIALAHYLDGMASAIIGTHTHVATRDTRVLPKGTLYQTDVGMTGPLNGIIGVEKEIVINRFLNGYTTPNEVAKGEVQLNAVFLDLTKKTIKAIHLEGENPILT